MIAEQQRLTHERDVALVAAKGIEDELEGLRKNQSDLLRLRGEVAMLRSQSNELDSLRKQNAELQQLAQLTGLGNQGTNKLPVVTKIIVTRIKQPQIISEEQIRTNISVKVGDIFNRAEVDLDVRNLSGLFHNLRVTDSTTDEGVILNYMLQEKPRLTGIRFAGSTKYRDADLKRLLASKVGQALDERTIYSEARRLEELYRTSGLPGTQVKSVVNINEDIGEGDVVFEIRE
jgi:outer membrane protein assembly factor BamA